ncbi:unnamed protein product [Polarella glacialis]|uniref:Uncharacterized protein n=1 Tax=Polarella glacialis TaxID=89957 RepID=A0A813IAE3_POLGL|nr:unnamed protein product [Polarella glacialis]
MVPPMFDPRVASFAVLGLLLTWFAAYYWGLGFPIVAWLALPLMISFVYSLLTGKSVVEALASDTKSTLWSPWMFAWIAFWMAFDLRYWYLPGNLAGAAFVTIYDPSHHLFGGGAAKSDLIPCTNTNATSSGCSFLPEYPTHVSWNVALFNQGAFDPWVMLRLRAHVLLNSIGLFFNGAQLYLISSGKEKQNRLVGRVAIFSQVVGTSNAYYIAWTTHGAIDAYGNEKSVWAFGSMWLSILVPAGLGMRAIYKGDVASHRRWMIRMYGALFGSFFYWRFMALVLQPLLSGPNGWLFYTCVSWMLGIVTFEISAQKAGMFDAQFYPELSEPLVKADYIHIG